MTVKAVDLAVYTSNMGPSDGCIALRSENFYAVALENLG